VNKTREATATRNNLFLKLWHAGVTTLVISHALGTTIRNVRRIRAELELPRRKSGRPKEN
jgi:hypothetical protein